MSAPQQTRIPSILAAHEQALLSEWLAEQQRSGVRRDDLIPEAESRRQSSEFLRLLRQAVNAGNVENVHAPEYRDVRELLTEISRNRALQGFTPTQTATFILSFKKPLFDRLRAELSGEELAAETWCASLLLDHLGLFVTEIYQRTREEVIARQQEELLELSTPVVKLWEGILALPIIGTLDSARTQVVMETLLQMIVETGAEVAIIDITGVPTVDTLVAQHLLKTVTAARLMGADCIISGIRPQIAQTIVHLGVDLQDVITKATLADAFTLALQRSGASISRGRARA
ncbi:MAG: STAS domain-containing protein [Armatimonadota bacterium]